MAVQNARCVFTYFCGGNKSNCRLYFHSSFNTKAGKIMLEREGNAFSFQIASSNILAKEKVFHSERK